MTKNDGGPVHPFKEEDGGGGYTQFPGISLRDHFAATALRGLINIPGRYGRVLEGMSAEQMEQDNYDRMAYKCYRFADAMISVREAKP